MYGQQLSRRNYEQQFQPEMCVTTKPEISVKTLEAFGKSWPQSHVAPRMNESGTVLNYYPFMKDCLDASGYYLAVKHSDGTVAVYHKSDLVAR